MVRPGHRTVSGAATCWADWCPGPTISVTFASVFKTGRYWHSRVWAHLADWAQPHLHQCKPVYLPVLFLIFTGCVGPVSCRLLLYWARCLLVFGWQAMRPGWRLNIEMSSYQYRDPRVNDHKNPLHLDVVDRYLGRMGDNTIMRLCWVWNRFITHELQVG